MRHTWVIVVSLSLLVLPASAAAQERWADPLVTDGGHSCAQDDPCRLGDAIEDAAAGAHVVLRPGEYDVASTLVAPGPITLEGEPGQPRPRLVGATNLATPVLELRDGGTLRRLAIVARGRASDALTLQGGLAEHLDLFSASGDGAKVVAASQTTVLRDSTVRAAGAGSSGLKLREGGAGGDVAVRNVTVVATGTAAAAVRCETALGRSTLVNVIARGSGGDVDAAANGSRCEAWHSNLRPALSPGVPLHPSNQDADPLLADPANGDLRVGPGSPVVDAGAADAFLGAADPDGRARVLGSAPDIGAYEQAGLPSTGPVPVVPTGEDDPAPGGTGELPPGLLPPTAPEPHRAVVIRTEEGTVAVRVPGAPGLVTLGAGAKVPLGSLVDARRGKVRLESATDAKGGTQSGVFHGGMFRVRQTAGRRPYTELVLAGGDFSRCPRPRGGVVRAAAARRKAVRRLWGSDSGGRFRTRGRSSSATVRGTEWLTEDRCAGTRVLVRSGAVDVRPNRGGPTRRVRAGQSLLVRRRAR